MDDASPAEPTTSEADARYTSEKVQKRGGRSRPSRGSVKPRSRGPARRPGALPIQERRSARTGTIYLYGDFRAYADVGGRVEPLRAAGERHATSDASVAARVYLERAAEYEARRAQAGREAQDRREAGDGPPHAVPHDAPAAAAGVVHLAAMIDLHVERKAAPRSGRRASTVRRDRANLAIVLQRIGDLPLASITPAVLDDYVLRREQEPGARAGTRISPSTIRNELHSLSNMFRRAVSLGYVPANPVARMSDKPSPPTAEAEFLTVQEAARLLDAAAALDQETRAARTAAALRHEAQGAGDARRSRRARALRDEARRVELEVGRRHPSAGRFYPWIEAITATLLYTGGRLSEGLGLLVEDIDFVRGRVHFRPNAYRRLKRDRHRREVELWPGLATVLLQHLTDHGIMEGLVFPTRAGGLMASFPKAFRRCVMRAGLATGRRITPHTLRHTHATMLLQTLVPTRDGRWAVRSSFEVAKRLGHRSSALVDGLYGHLVPDPEYVESLSYEEHRARHRDG